MPAMTTARRGAINRFGEMDMFVRVVEAGGFSAAARAAGLTASAVSKLVSRMETRLGTKLVLRTTRSFALTPAGTAYYERALRILADLDEAEMSAGTGERVAGTVRISASAAYLTHILAPILPAFLASYREIRIEIPPGFPGVDLDEARADIAIRSGPVAGANPLARKLGASPMAIVAAPAWIAAHGLPETIDALARHERIGFDHARAVKGWPLLTGKGLQIMLLPVDGRLVASDAEAARHLALAGAGPARLPTYQLQDDLAAGRLVTLLDDANPGDREAVHAVYVGGAAALPARFLALLDHLAEHGRVDGQAG